MRHDLDVAQGVLRFERNDGEASLTPSLIGDADHGGFGYRRHLIKHVLDFRRIHVLAARDVHVLPAIDDVVEAVFVHARRVAGMQPALGK